MIRRDTSIQLEAEYKEQVLELDRKPNSTMGQLWDLEQLTEPLCALFSASVKQR